MKKLLYVLPMAALLTIASCSQGSKDKSESKEPESASSIPAASVEESSKEQEPSSSVEESSKEQEPSSRVEESSNEQESSSADGDGYLIKEPTTIELVSNSSYTDDLDSFIASFKKIEPNVTVINTKESTSYDGVKDKIVDGLAANNYADLAVLYPDAIGTLMDYGVVRQLDPYMTNETYGWSDDDLDDIIPAYLQEGTEYILPGTYSLPFSKSTEAMFYNKCILGLDLSKFDSSINGGNPISEEYINNLTWDELFDHLAPALVSYNNTLDDERKILRDNATYTKAVFGYDSDDNLFITLAEQYGYGYTEVDPVTGEGKLLFNNDGMKGLMKKFKAAYDNGYFFTKGSSKNGKYTNFSFTASSALFTVGSTGGLKYQVAANLDTGVARIPQAPAGEGRKNSLISQGPSICLLDHKDDNRALAAWLFYKHMTNEMNSLKWALDTGYSPIRYSNMETNDYLDVASEEGKELYSLDMVKARVFQYVADEKVASSFYTTPVFKGSDAARTVCGSLVTTLLMKDKGTLTDEIVNTEFDKAENTIKTKM